MEEVEVRLRELQEGLTNLKSLIDHAGWKRLVEIADGQIENRMPSVFTRLDSLLEVTGSEFDKGEISGIKLFQALPSNYINDLEESISKMEEELEFDDDERERPDEGRTDSGADSGTDGGFEPAI